MNNKNEMKMELRNTNEIILELKNRILSRIELAISPENEFQPELCGTYSLEDFEYYWDGSLPDEQKKQMESHCFECLPCLEAFEQAYEESEQEKQLIDFARNFI